MEKQGKWKENLPKPENKKKQKNKTFQKKSEPLLLKEV